MDPGDEFTSHECHENLVYVNTFLSIVVGYVKTTIRKNLSIGGQYR